MYVGATNISENTQFAKFAKYNSTPKFVDLQYLPNSTSKAKSSEIKESVSVYCLLVRGSNYVVNFQKFTSNWSWLTKRLSGTTLEPL